MDRDDEYVGTAVLRVLREVEPSAPSIVDVRRAVAEGRRKRRARRAGAYLAAAVVTALVLAGVAAALASVREVPATLGPTVTVTRLQPPTACGVSALSVPEGSQFSGVSGGDRTGRRLVGGASSRGVSRC